MDAIKLVVDFERCTGHGRCYSVAPTLLTYDEEGFVNARHEPVELAESDLPDAKSAVDACPELAMRISYGTE
jgi:ferredoxin